MQVKCRVILAELQRIHRREQRTRKEETTAMKFGGILSLALAMATVACGPMSTGQVKDLNVKDWVGHSSAHLIQAWGPPHHDDPTADGGRAIGYLFANQAVTGPKSQVIFQARRCMINFTVDAKGIIDDASATGSTCTIGPHSEMHPPASKS
jgi:hypothetical protein